MSNPLLDYIANNLTTLSITAGSAVTGFGVGSVAAQKELVNRCSEWIGIKLSATRIQTEAKAQGEAALTKAEYDVQVERIKQLGEIENAEEVERALAIRAAKTTKEQRNVDAIVAGALPKIQDGANPQNINEDWLNNFFDKGRLISDTEMQELWSRVLAGEANSPGKYSKRLVNLLQSMEKIDAEEFRGLCRFSVSYKPWRVPVPLVFSTSNVIYRQQMLDDPTLNGLQSLGLIRYELGSKGWGNFVVKADRIICGYFGYTIVVEIVNSSKDSIEFGRVSLTPLGEELAGLCDLNPIKGFPQYLAETWRAMDHKVTLIPPETGNAA